MEKRGMVNEYIPYKQAGESVLIINLANGTTPFMHFFDGKEYASNMYNVRGTRKRIKIEYAHYRPDRQEFDRLEPDMQEFVLNGAMLAARIEKAHQMPNDPVLESWDYEAFQRWAEMYYGKRLMPMSNGVSP